MSYAGFLDRLRAKTYATTRTPANVTIYGPNSFTCVPPFPSPNHPDCHHPQPTDPCPQPHPPCPDPHPPCPDPCPQPDPCYPDNCCGPDIQYCPGYPGPMNDVPIGTIVFNYGTTLPCGWLRCNGNIISGTKYAALIQIIGTSMLPNIPPLYPGGCYIIKY